MRYLILLLILIPAGEIGVLLLSGKMIGIVPTILMIIFTGIIGSYLAKKQGLETIRKAQQQVNMGMVPGEALLDGICILVGGVFLLSPGFITDVFGIFLLAPPTRKYVKKLLTKGLTKWLNNGNVTIIR